MCSHWLAPLWYLLSYFLPVDKNKAPAPGSCPWNKTRDSLPDLHGCERWLKTRIHNKNLAKLKATATSQLYLKSKPQLDALLSEINAQEPGLLDHASWRGL